MTQNEEQLYQKFLAKATIEGLRVIGRGTVKTTKQQFIAVSSSDGTGCYLVIIAGHTLACNCKAGRGGQYCKHRALARSEIVNRAAAHAALDEQQERDREDYEMTTGHDIYDEDAARAAALPMRRDTGPRLYRDDAHSVAVLEERATEEW